jgi:hypothetical protein
MSVKRFTRSPARKQKPINRINQEDDRLNLIKNRVRDRTNFTDWDV